MAFAPPTTNFFDEKYKIINRIKAIDQELDYHPVCTALTSRSRIKIFILYHIFDVWDIEKLTPSLQNKISVALLEKTYKHQHKLKRMLETTILNRPAELYPYGKPNRDFANYLHAVAEIGIDPNFYLWHFLETPNNMDKLKPGIRELVEFNSSVANWGTISEMIAMLLLRKKQLDTQTFIKIVRVLTSEGKECPFLLGYTEKLCQNLNIKSEPLAFRLLNHFCQDEAEQIRALQTGLKALCFRKQLWNCALAEITRLK